MREFGCMTFIGEFSFFPTPGDLNISVFAEVVKWTFKSQCCLPVILLDL